MDVRGLTTALVLAAIVAGCGLMAERQERQEAKVVGDRLVTAGFRRIPADTPARQSQLAKLPKLLFASTTIRGKRRHLLADPDRCRCLYVGDEAAYQRYTNLELGDEETISTRAQDRDDRLAGVNDATPDISAFDVDVVMEGQSE
jgi:hypothetical protein